MLFDDYKIVERISLDIFMTPLSNDCVLDDPITFSKSTIFANLLASSASEKKKSTLALYENDMLA